MRRATRLALLLLLSLATSTAQGHYLWVVLSRDGGEHGKAHVFFEETAFPGDGEYLDPFVTRGKAWIRALDVTEPQPLELKEHTTAKHRWLAADLPAAEIRNLESYGQWGVYRYGERDILLHYYAKTIEAQSAEELDKLARAEHLDLDLVPHASDGKLELTVLWHGEPIADREVILRGPSKYSAKAKTDAEGKVSFDLLGKGRYLARTSVEEPEKSGEFEGKTYQLVRHNGTLVIHLPIE